MWPGSLHWELPATVFTILAELIHERIGLQYELDKRELLADKLSPLAEGHGFASFLDYYYLLKYGPDEDAEWPRVMDALSVQETYFWREISQIRAFVDQILPKHFSKYRDEPVRIWCAACATGEEPLTIAMALAEASWFERADIQISATDASPAAIAKARQGFYRERSFRSLPETFRSKYFGSVPGGWRVSSELLERISWSNVNLIDATEVGHQSRVPFIFCRNVFIYFAEQTIRRTVREFAKGMTRPGYLFVGASESLLKISHEFELEEAGNAFVYALK